MEGFERYNCNDDHDSSRPYSRRPLQDPYIQYKGPGLFHAHCLCIINRDHISFAIKASEENHVRGLTFYDRLPWYDSRGYKNVSVICESGWHGLTEYLSEQNKCSGVARMAVKLLRAPAQGAEVDLANMQQRRSLCRICPLLGDEGSPKGAESSPQLN